MLNKILMLCNRHINTEYEILIPDGPIRVNSNEGILAVTDREEDLEILNKSGIPVLFVSSEDRFIPGAGYVTYSPEECDDKYFDMVYSRQMGLPVTVFETERTIVREMTLKDLEELYVIYDDDLIRRYVEPLYPYEEEKEFTEKYIRNMYGMYGYGLWMVIDKATGNIIGRIGISIRKIDGRDCNELGYLVRKEYRRKGVAYEVCKAVTEYAFGTLGIDELYIVTAEDNGISLKLCSKLEFEYYGEYSGENTRYLVFKKNL